LNRLRASSSLAKNIETGLIFSYFHGANYFNYTALELLYKVTVFLGLPQFLGVSVLLLDYRDILSTKYVDYLSCFPLRLPLLLWTVNTCHNWRELEKRNIPIITDHYEAIQSMIRKD
jgi:hypothetical protein